uniref:VWFA domain-containing protein n=1 Tax=Oryzias latipes TaxID=8090 RepID=A0A3P9I2S8_ORYLA
MIICSFLWSSSSSSIRGEPLLLSPCSPSMLLNPSPVSSCLCPLCSFPLWLRLQPWPSPLQTLLLYPGDLVFLIDSSGSIYPQDYEKMKDFMKFVISRSFIGRNEVHVGVLQFSSSPQPEFDLRSFFSKEEMLQAIDGMQQLGGGTLTGDALTASIREYFETSRGSRRSEGISQNLVLITDGESQDDVEDPADDLRALGIEIFAIGIGDVHDLELLQITGTPQRLFTVQNFGSLENIKQKVVDTICKSKPSGDPSCEAAGLNWGRLGTEGLPRLSWGGGRRRKFVFMLSLLLELLLLDLISK